MKNVLGLLVEDRGPSSWGLGDSFAAVFKHLPEEDCTSIIERVSRVVFREGWKSGTAGNPQAVSALVGDELRFMAPAVASMSPASRRFEIAVALASVIAFSRAEATDLAEGWLVLGLVAHPEDATWLAARRHERARVQALLHCADLEVPPALQSRAG